MRSKFLKTKPKNKGGCMACEIGLNNGGSKNRKPPCKRPIGRGFISDTFKKVKQAIFFPSDTLSNSSQKVFNKYRTKKIILIEIRRAPIYSQIDKALNIISLGTFSKAKKALAYDNMYHLSAILTFEDGSQVKIEKNEKINITTDVKPMKDTETIEIRLGRNALSFDLLFYNAEKAVGKRRFYQYSAFEYNCQRFILDLLESSNLDTPQATKFILQNAIELASRLPDYVLAISQFITDTAGKLRELTGGKITRKDVIEILYDDQKQTKKAKRKIVRFNNPPEVYLEDEDFKGNFDDLLDAYCNENKGPTDLVEIPDGYFEEEKKKREINKRKREDSKRSKSLAIEEEKMLKQEVNDLKDELKQTRTELNATKEALSEHKLSPDEEIELKYQFESLRNEIDRLKQELADCEEYKRRLRETYVSDAKREPEMKEEQELEQEVGDMPDLDIDAELKALDEPVSRNPTSLEEKKREEKYHTVESKGVLQGLRIPQTQIEAINLLHNLGLNLNSKHQKGKAHWYLRYNKSTNEKAKQKGVLNKASIMGLIPISMFDEESEFQSAKATKTLDDADSFKELFERLNQQASLPSNNSKKIWLNDF